MNLSVLPKSRLKKAFSNVISAFIPFRRARKRVRDILFFGLIKYIKAKRAEANSNFENFLSICAIAKDEGCYFKEWIEYHRLVGVEKFYIYDNNSTDNTREVLEPYVKEGIADYISFPGEKMQLPAYRDAICKFKDKTKYMAFIDLDEFIVPPENQTIADFLRQMEKSKVQTLSPIHRQKEFLKCGGDSGGFSIAGGVCN
ncbi:MAG: glycosyltransferase family 92 protein, partial [Elusimicrobiota bacterium]|nr:glycosyltransferase family 92 protein [Elusimicrobiota bacterium]